MTVIIRRLAILILCLMRFHVRAATERYIIYPKEELPFKERLEFTDKVKLLAGLQGNVYTSIRHPPFRGPEIRFWCADLTLTAYKALVQDPKVRATEHIYDVINNR